MHNKQVLALPVLLALPVMWQAQGHKLLAQPVWVGQKPPVPPV